MFELKLSGIQRLFCSQIASVMVLNKLFLIQSLSNYNNNYEVLGIEKSKYRYNIKISINDLMKGEDSIINFYLGHPGDYLNFSKK